MRPCVRRSPAGRGPGPACAASCSDIGGPAAPRHEPSLAGLDERRRALWATGRVRARDGADGADFGFALTSTSVASDSGGRRLSGQSSTPRQAGVHFWQGNLVSGGDGSKFRRGPGHPIHVSGRGKVGAPAPGRSRLQRLLPDDRRSRRPLSDGGRRARRARGRRWMRWCRSTPRSS